MTHNRFEKRSGGSVSSMPLWLGGLRARYGAWSPVVRVYLAFSAILHLGWEVGQLPLYTLYRQAPTGTIIYSVLHCTIGDLLIATATLLLAIGATPSTASTGGDIRRVVLWAIALGVGYTVFSEWLNVEVRNSWSYTDAMPRLPPLGTGLAPALQWTIVPSLAFWFSVRTRRSDHV